MNRSNRKGYSITELVITLSIMVIGIGALILVLVSSTDMFYKTKRQLLDVIKQKVALSHINDMINESAFGKVFFDPNTDGHWDSVNLYYSDGLLKGTYTNMAVSLGNSVDGLRWMDKEGNEKFFERVNATFKQVRPVSGTKAVEIGINFSRPIASLTYVEPQLDIIVPECGCITENTGGEGDGWSQAIYSHTWARYIGGADTEYYKTSEPIYESKGGQQTGYLICGHTLSYNPPGSLLDILIVVTDNDGVPVMSKNEGVNIGPWDYDEACCATQMFASNGLADGFMVFGLAWAENVLYDRDMIIFKLNSTGDEIWRQYYYVDPEFDYEMGPFPRWVKQVFDPDGNSMGFTMLGFDCDIDNADPDTAGQVPYTWGNPVSGNGDAQISMTNFTPTGTIVSQNMCIPWGTATDRHQEAYNFVQTIDDDGKPGFLAMAGTWRETGSPINGWPLFVRIDPMGSYEVPDAVHSGTAFVAYPETFNEYQIFIGKICQVLNSAGKPAGFIVPIGFETGEMYVLEPSLWYLDNNFGQVWLMKYTTYSSAVLYAVRQYHSTESSAATGFYTVGTESIIRSSYHGAGDPDQPAAFWLKTDSNGNETVHNHTGDYCRNNQRIMDGYQVFDPDGRDDGYVMVGEGGIGEPLSENTNEFVILKTDVYGNCPEIAWPDIYTGEPGNPSKRRSEIGID